VNHIQAGIFVSTTMLIVVLVLTGLAHFVGGTWAGIILTATVVVGVAAAVLDYLTEER
jgi:hypothetical protein